MSSLEIFHLATAVVKFIDFSQRLLSETWHIYRSVSGESVAQTNLTTLSRDLSELHDAIKTAISKNNQNGEAVNEKLLSHCDACTRLKLDIHSIIEKVDKDFQTRQALGQSAGQSTTREDDGALSLGEAFRKAARSWWHQTVIDDLREQCSETRNRVLGTIMSDIWDKVANGNKREEQFSNKLDTLISMLHTSLDISTRTGPLSLREGETTSVKQHRQTVQDKVKDVSSSGTRRLSGVMTGHLWSRQWQPDPSLLTFFPKQTFHSKYDLIKFISDTLRFETMDSREHAITQPFPLTYDWIFMQHPLISDSEEQLWSSFPDWLEDKSNGTYWITGKPGSGKSTMMKFIAKSSALNRHLQHWAKDSPVHKIKYYAWKPGLELGKSLRGLLQTMIHQMLVLYSDLTPQLCPRRWAHFHLTRTLDEASFQPWTTWELEESLDRLLSHLNQSTHRVVLFIDGLDEFDTAPVDICAKVQYIASHRNIKVCVASRPWAQFSDAFSQSPGLQMHLLTQRDIRAFVNGHFQGVAAFQELNRLYPGSGDMLLSEIVQRSQGVFLWTALVTRTILEALIEGSSLPKLQETLDSMPNEIESLYDAIFTTIPERLLPDVSAILQLYVLPIHPLQWQTLWLADEIRDGSVTATMPLRDFNHTAAQAVLRRRLSARTRGILELATHSEYVEYLHRTAAEWLRLPRVWKRIQSFTPEGFNPFYYLAKAETIQIGWLDLSQRATHDKPFWSTIVAMFYYASQIDRHLTSDGAITSMLSVLEAFCSGCLKSDTTFMTPQNRSNTFLGLAAQFAILPYIRHKLPPSTNSVYRTPSGTVPLLQQAIFGPEPYNIPEGLTDSNLLMSETAMWQRLEVIEALLIHGIRQRELETMIKGDPRRREPFFQDVSRLLKKYPSTNTQRVKEYFGSRISRRLGS